MQRNRIVLTSGALACAFAIALAGCSFGMRSQPSLMPQDFEQGHGPSCSKSKFLPGLDLVSGVVFLVPSLMLYSVGGDDETLGLSLIHI